jgi:tetratricopeptide (TPR) repeat protein
LHPSARTFLPVYKGPSRGLPPQVAVPISLLATAAVLAVVLWFLKTALTVPGSALGPNADSMGASLPQRDAAQGTSVGGGSAAVAVGVAPPAPIQRLLTEFKTRLARNPRDRAALIGLARLYAEAGKYSQALPYYERALALRRHSPSLEAEYANVVRQAGAPK